MLGQLTKGRHNCVSQLQDSCVAVFASNYWVGKWNNQYCSNTNGYVCQQARRPEIGAPWPSPGLRQCEPGWVPYMQDCYKYYTGSLTWGNARAVRHKIFLGRQLSQGNCHPHFRRVPAKVRIWLP